MERDRNIQEKFLSLLRYSIGTDEEPPVDILPSDWTKLFAMAESQAVIGVCASGIEHLPDDLRPSLPSTMLWAMSTIRIEARNKLLNARCAELANMLNADGFSCCILKGQGAALYYPDPLRRQSGDIDVWVSGGHQKVMEYVRGRFPGEGAYYHHADFPVFDDVPVEIHFTPSWSSSPTNNKILQKWFAGEMAIQHNHKVELPGGVGEVPVPNIVFNLVYMLLHIYRHLFSEGIGLRQCIDYYFVLKAFGEAGAHDKENVCSLLDYLGLYRFARTMMYVMSALLHVPDKLLIAPPDTISGRFVANEIMRAGNFGRENNIDRSKGKTLKFFVQKLIYKMRFVLLYPEETFWGLWFSVWAKVWRKKNGYTQC